MNTTTIGAISKTLTSTTKFESLTLADIGIVLQCNKTKVSEISYSELDKIYIIVYKLKPVYGFLFFLIPMLFAFLFFDFLELNIEMSVAFLPVIPAYIKHNSFRKFGLVLVLRDRSVFKKLVSKKAKSDAVELINEVKKKCLKSTF